jgi:gluconokinase
MTPPRSGYDKAGGMAYFPRMLDKIRLHARGELHPDYHANLGRGRAADGICCGFLRVEYAALRDRVLQGGTDEEILEWCYAQSRPLSPADLMVWNEFVRKFGWNDLASPVLRKCKAESGLEARDDLVTMFEYFDVDEGRKS